MTSSKKRCSKCKVVKLLTEFYKKTKGKDGHQTYCKECHKQTFDDHLKRNPDRNLLQRYGITGEEKTNMAQGQGNCCAICRTPFSDKLKPCVDHCHASTYVRGILCRHCNTGLGHFQDSPKLLQRAIHYIDYHAEKIAASSVSTGDHQQGQDDPQHGTLLATWTGQDDNHPDHHSGAIPGQDLDHCAQTGSGDSMGHRGKEVAASEPFTRIEDHGQPDAEIVRLEFGRRDLFD